MFDKPEMNLVTILFVRGNIKIDFASYCILGQNCSNRTWIQLNPSHFSEVANLKKRNWVFATNSNCQPDSEKLWYFTSYTIWYYTIRSLKYINVNVRHLVAKSLWQRLNWWIYWNNITKFNVSYHLGESWKHFLS